jgi:hypothetical protein
MSSDVANAGQFDSEELTQRERERGVSSMLSLIDHQTFQQEFHPWTKTPNFATMYLDKFLKDIFAAFTQSDEDLASIVGTLLTHQQLLLHGAVDQTDSAVMGDLKLFSQFTDADRIAPRKAFDS